MRITRLLAPALVLLLLLSAALPAVAAGPLGTLEKDLAKTKVGEEGKTGTDGASTPDKPPADTTGTGAGKEGESGEKESFTLALLADVHASPDNAEGLARIIAAVNRLAPDAVGVLGDLSYKIGCAAELGRAYVALEPLRMKRYIIPGNHDVRSSDKLDEDGEKVVATPAERKMKLERFAKAFGNKDNFMTVKRAGHLLVFLPIDALKAKSIVAISEGSLKRLRKALAENRDLPTAIFCHAPMLGSVKKAGKSLGPVHGFAQPNDELRAILKENRQVYLWVSGHLHISPDAPDFHEVKVNTVAGVHNIHCPGLKKNPRYFNVIRFDPKGCLVRTYDVRRHNYITKHTRRIAARTSGDAVADDDRKDDDPDGGDTVPPGKDPEAGDEFTGGDPGSAGTPTAPPADPPTGTDSTGTPTAPPADPPVSDPPAGTDSTGTPPPPPAEPPAGTDSTGIPTPPPADPPADTGSGATPPPADPPIAPPADPPVDTGSGATPPPPITFTQDRGVVDGGTQGDGNSAGTPAGTPPGTPPGTDAGTATAPPTPAIGSANNRHTGPVTMRGSKALESDALVQIPAGAQVELLSHEGDWCKVRFDGKEGFVRAYYLGLGK